jgi:exonuclease SbcC
MEKQSIDFEELTSRGLFGIFGPTGSGKSTILDAITLAMYGNISRNTKEFINSLSSEAVISYEFEIGAKNSKRRYLVDRNFKRRSNGKPGMKTSYARLVEVHADGTTNVLADKVGEVTQEIIGVIGLTAEDFTRSVVLPQGKFNEFLKLTGSGRRDMLERIFNLEKYGRELSEKVKTRKYIKIDESKLLSSRMSAYDNVSKEMYDETAKVLSELKKSEKEKNIEVEEIQKRYDKDKDTLKRQMELDRYKKQFDELETSKDEIEKKKVLVEKSTRATMLIPHIEYYEKLEEKISVDTVQLDGYKNRYTMIKRELEHVKQRYEENAKSKDVDIPRLNAEKSRYEYAIKLEEELNELLLEMQSLKNNTEEFRDLKSGYEAEIKVLDVEISKSSKEIGSVSENLDDISISVEQKQKIFSAYDYEKQYVKLDEDKKYNQTKVEELREEISYLKNEYRYLEQDVKESASKLEEKKSHLDFLTQKSPGSTDDVLVKTQEIIELKNLVENISRDEKHRNELQVQLTKIDAKIFDLEKEIKDISSALEKNTAEKDDMKDDINRLQSLNLANRLRLELVSGKACPVCGSVHHEDVEERKYDGNIEFLESKLQKIEAAEKDLEEKLQNVNLDKHSLDKTRDMKYIELQSIKSTIGDKSSDECQRKLLDSQKELSALKASMEKWSAEVEDINKEISKLAEEKSKLELEEIKLKESILNKEGILKSLEAELDADVEEYEKIKNTYLGLATSLKINNISSVVEEINENEKKIETLSKSINELQSKKDVKELKFKEITEKLNQITIELVMEEESFSTKKAIIKGKRDEIDDITKGMSAAILLSQVDEDIAKIYETDKRMTSELKDTNEEFEKNISRRSILESELDKNKSEFEMMDLDVKKLIIQNGFKDIYDVKGSISEKAIIDRINIEIEDYLEKRKFLTIKIQELDMGNSEKIILEDELGLLKNKIINLRQEIINISKDIGKNENMCFVLRDKLEKIKLIDDELKIVNHDLDLLEDLDKAIQGNKFVEYVATNQLKYISLEASKKLKSMTKGRYQLEIDDTLNFVMRDNFNGGERRSVDTLSGGETFLTSLSLALALSTQIQLKGRAPLEFFFLDEGFGSLDSELLEIVIESLERLHSENLSVGIISHIEELKNRVPIKLLVSPSKTGVGSKIKIEYS